MSGDQERDAAWQHPDDGRREPSLHEEIARLRTQLAASHEACHAFDFVLHQAETKVEALQLQLAEAQAHNDLHPRISTVIHHGKSCDTVLPIVNTYLNYSGELVVIVEGMR